MIERVTCWRGGVVRGEIVRGEGVRCEAVRGVVVRGEAVVCDGVRSDCLKGMGGCVRGNEIGEGWLEEGGCSFHRLLVETETSKSTSGNSKYADCAQITSKHCYTHVLYYVEQIFATRSQRETSIHNREGRERERERERETFFPTYLIQGG